MEEIKSPIPKVYLLVYIDALEKESVNMSYTIEDKIKIKAEIEYTKRLIQNNVASITQLKPKHDEKILEQTKRSPLEQRIYDKAEQLT